MFPAPLLAKVEGLGVGLKNKGILYLQPRFQLPHLRKGGRVKGKIFESKNEANERARASRSKFKMIFCFSLTQNTQKYRSEAIFGI